VWSENRGHVTKRRNAPGGGGPGPRSSHLGKCCGRWRLQLRFVPFIAMSLVLCRNLQLPLTLVPSSLCGEEGGGGGVDEVMEP